MLLVVCDSTPLIYLARIGQFELLRQLHEAVLVPPAVWQEVAVRGSHFPEGCAVQQAASAGWLRVERPCGTLELSSDEVEDLDPGESEAIQLAVERGALLAVDESHGREVAAKLGVKLTGTVGILVRARRDGLIPSVQSALAQLRRTTFRLSANVYLQALASVGEADVQSQS